MTPEATKPEEMVSALDDDVHNKDDHIIEVVEETTAAAADITSAEGKQQASVGETPLSLYLQQMGEMQVQAVEKLFSSTVDAPCSQEQASTDRNYSSQTSDLSGSARDHTNQCHPMLSCQQTIEYQLDILTHCRQPLEFFPFLHDAHHQNRTEGNAITTTATVPVGMYTVPLACEYCGVADTRECPESCQRPKLYFQKKRPPFASRKNWDPVTEYEKPPPPPTPPMETPSVNRTPAWVAGLFGKRNTSSSPNSETTK